MSNPANGVYKETLPNGLVVITEPMEYFHSVSVGVWLRNGSRREPRHALSAVPMALGRDTTVRSVKFS